MYLNNVEKKSILMQFQLIITVFFLNDLNKINNQRILEEEKSINYK